jgi:hypothetical protein
MLPEHSDPAPTPQQDHLNAPEERRRSWRDTLQVHPACALFPPMPPNELRDLGEDIKQNGLLSPVVLWTPDTLNDDEPVWLLDGRNRLDALEVELGRPVRVVGRVRRFRGESGKVWTIETDDEDGKAVSITGSVEINWIYILPIYVVVRGANEDIEPYSYVVSVNIRRRHLKARQKRDLIAKLIKATPEKSDRLIAKTVKASPTTVGTVRAEMEAMGDVSKLDTRTDTKGRQQPATKAKTKTKAEAKVAVNAEPDEVDVARLQARIGELEDALHQRDSKIIGLQTEIEELKAARAPERPDVRVAAEIVEVYFDEFIATMSPTLRAKLERKVRAEKNGGDGDIDPNRTITRMIQSAIERAVAAEDPNTDPGGAVAKSNRTESQKLLRDVDRKVRAMRFAPTDLVAGFAKGAQPKRVPASKAANADKTTVVAATETNTFH